MRRRTYQGGDIAHTCGRVKTLSSGRDLDTASMMGQKKMQEGGFGNQNGIICEKEKISKGSFAKSHKGRAAKKKVHNWNTLSRKRGAS